MQHKTQKSPESCIAVSKPHVWFWEILSYFFPLEFQSLKSINSCRALSSSDIMAQNACSVWAAACPVLLRV